MRRIFFPLLAGILLLTVQTTLMLSLPIHRIRPDLTLIFVQWLAFSYLPLPGGFLAFCLGYLLDLFSGNSFGLYTFSRTLLFYALYRFKDHFYLEGFVSQSFLAFISALLEGILLIILIAVFNPHPLPSFYISWFWILLPQSFFTGLISPLLLPLFDKGSAYLLQNNSKVL
jgi:rod shape-determining protein MreD